MSAPFKVPLLTKYEKRMLKMLQEVVPNYHVLSQVSFGALLDAPKLAGRNVFNRKIADFVILDESLEVICIIELDDYTHKFPGKPESDQKRDQMLHKAGYFTLRYYHLPNARQVKTDIKKLAKKQVKSKNEKLFSIKEIILIFGLLVFIVIYLKLKWLR